MEIVYNDYVFKIWVFDNFDLFEEIVILLCNEMESLRPSDAMWHHRSG